MMSKLKYVYMFFLLGAFLFVIPLEISAQEAYATKKIALLVEKLNEKGLSVETLETNGCKDLGVRNQFSIRRSSQGVIEHIGVKLFDGELYDKFPSPLYPFMERYFLELLLIDNDKALQTKLHLERVKISSECYPGVPLLDDFRKMVEDFSTDCSLFIRSQHNRHRVMVSKGQKVLCSFYFPISYEMITGISKIEAEESVYPELSHYLANNTFKPIVDKSELSDYKDSVYVLNDACYMSEDIRSNAYYVSYKDRVYPIRSSEYGIESVRNLFNAAHNWKVNAEVTLKKYGNKETSFEIPVSRLMDFIRKKNCNIYVGIRKFDKRHIQGVVLALNDALGYQHLMMFSLPTSFIENREVVRVKMKMYAYIPIHNVSSFIEAK